MFRFFFKRDLLIKLQSHLRNEIKSLISSDSSLPRVGWLLRNLSGPLWFRPLLLMFIHSVVCWTTAENKWFTKADLTEWFTGILLICFMVYSSKSEFQHLFKLDSSYVTSSKTAFGSIKSLFVVCFEKPIAENRKWQWWSSTHLELYLFSSQYSVR